MSNRFNHQPQRTNIKVSLNKFGNPFEVLPLEVSHEHDDSHPAPSTPSGEMQPTSTLFSLPPELFDQIISYLPRRTLLSISQTCKPLYSLSLPQIYRTIHINFRDPRKDHASDRDCSNLAWNFAAGLLEGNRFARVNQLLRTLLGSRGEELAGFVSEVEMVRWNVTSGGAGVAQSSDGEQWGQIRSQVFDFTRGEVKALHKAVRRIRHLYPSSLVGVSDSEAEKWENAILREGDLDASFALIMVLISQANVKQYRTSVHDGNEPRLRGPGLRELKLTLDHCVWRTQPKYLWKVFRLFWPTPPAEPLSPSPSSRVGYHNSVEDRGKAQYDTQTITTTPDGVQCSGLPFLITLSIVTNRFPHPELETYDADFASICLPIMLSDSYPSSKTLNTLQLKLLDESPFSWPGIHPPPRLSTLTSLTLQNAHLLTLASILQCTPALKHLSYTYLLNLNIFQHHWLDYKILSSALQNVKSTVETLKLAMFVFGDRYTDINFHLAQAGLLSGFGPRGDSRELGLKDFSKLREYEGGLAVLLGPGGNSKMSLDEALPEGLEVLRLVDENRVVGVGNFTWERREVEGLVEEFIKSRRQRHQARARERMHAGVTEVNSSRSLSEIVFVEQCRAGSRSSKNGSNWPRIDVLSKLVEVGRSEEVGLGAEMRTGVVEVTLGEDYSRREWVQSYPETGDYGWVFSPRVQRMLRDTPYENGWYYFWPEAAPEGVPMA